MTRPPEEALKFLVSVLLVGTTLAQTPAKQQLLWQKLDATLHEVDRNLDGVMGVAIKDLTSNHTILLQPGEVFPQASSIKIAVLVELYRQALAASPDFAEALLNLGIALETLGQKDEARASWQKALTLKPELARGYFQ